MQKSYLALPTDYKPYLSVDLQKDKKLALLINGLAILIGIAMAVPMHFVVPINTLFDLSGGLLPYTVRFISLILGIILYMVLHEAVHGIAMKMCGTKQVKYGFTGLYAYAGSSDFYSKSAYIFIVLAPVILWGIVLFVINFLVPQSWFWVVYIIQIANISGAAGDTYVTVRFAKLPSNILVQDNGTAMTVYTKQ
ncbi:MAG: DUF3267 domain-containing protein [Clostridia bacterium]|nr:DUF3267 domain-containing protein [Clostridia bacterium]